MVICGIDPGTSGALTFVDTGDASRVIVYDMQVANKREGPVERTDLIRQQDTRKRVRAWSYKKFHELKGELVKA